MGKQQNRILQQSSEDKTRIESASRLAFVSFNLPCTHPGFYIDLFSADVSNANIACYFISGRQGIMHSITSNKHVVYSLFYLALYIPPSIINPDILHLRYSTFGSPRLKQLVLRWNHWYVEERSLWMKPGVFRCKPTLIFGVSGRFRKGRVPLSEHGMLQSDHCMCVDVRKRPRSWGLSSDLLCLSLSTILMASFSGFN